MDVSIFFFIIININLVLTDENVAMESSTAYQNTHKSRSDSENNKSQNDQIAESSHSISQTYATEVLKNIQNDNQNQIRLSDGKSFTDVKDVYDGQNTQQIVQKTVHSPEILSHETADVNDFEILQPALTQGYTQHQPQPVYVQYPLHPIRIFGSEASPLHQHQIHETEGQTLGYSSYVEHEFQKDEEEIKSAMKEGSISDIKRLVPKSGISFKIYKNDKNINPNIQNSKPEAESPHIPGDYSQISKLHHRIKAEVPVIQLHNQPFQTLYKQQHSTTGLEGAQNTYQQNGEQQHGLEDSQHLMQTIGVTPHSHDQQSLNGQIHYFVQPEIKPQKTYLEISGKNSPPVQPHFKINKKDRNYNKATSTSEFNSLSTHGLTDMSNFQKQINFDSNTKGSQKTVKKIKPIALQKEIDPVAVAERNQGRYIQTHDTGNHVAQTNFIQHKANNFAETQKISGKTNYHSSSYTAKGNQNNFVEHLAENGYSDKQTTFDLKNRIPGNYANAENTKSGPNHIVSHLGTSVYGESQGFKGVQSEYFATTSYPDSEPAKSGQHNLISPVEKNSHIETKNSQNFDHQKALEGSTSFDIKNAIDSSGTLIHQTSHVKPASDSYFFEGFQKQQLAHVGSKTPTSTVLLDTGILESPVAEGHQIKNFGIPSAQLSYHPVSPPAVSGKFFHQPQTIMWASEHLKQGNLPTANDLHQSLIKLHLPKEDFYHHVKVPNIELPTSSVSHYSYHQKQPYVVHNDVPFVKYPQGIHFQPKTKTRIQNQGGNLKVGQPLAIDWSLFKSTFPNFNINSLATKPELTPHIQETGKKIIPILIRKRKNRSNNKQEVGMVVYGKVNNKRRPSKPSFRQEKNVRVNLLPEAGTNVKQFEPNGERKNEFSVSASYKVDRSFKIP